MFPWYYMHSDVYSTYINEKEVSDQQNYLAVNKLHSVTVCINDRLQQIGDDQNFFCKIWQYSFARETLLIKFWRERVQGFSVN